MIPETLLHFPPGMAQTACLEPGFWYEAGGLGLKPYRMGYNSVGPIQVLFCRSEPVVELKWAEKGSVRPVSV